ncbi:MAG: hypothetical protein PVH17_13125 [Anaerolineae bacterium]
MASVRLLLPLGWALAAVGYYGPWIAHKTAALTLSGVDMGEFVKFLPGALDGTLGLTRWLFYLPPAAIVVGVALLIGSQRLGFSWMLRLPVLALSIPVSLQLLPPAWSPVSLMTAEFRLQTIVLGVCWLLLAGFWLVGKLPPWLSGTASAALALAAGTLSAWQFLLVKPAIDDVYNTPPPVGWGFPLCLVGLAMMTLAGVILMVRTRVRSAGPW